MEYDDNTIEPIEGAFMGLHHTENPYLIILEKKKLLILKILKDISDNEENKILVDNNLISIKNSPEFLTNKNHDKPTNRICTSLLQKNRLLLFIQYGLVYVKDKNEFQKHILRYPQFFALKSIKEKIIDQGQKKGIIWHTQGSGKTALTYLYKISFRYL